MGRTRLHVNVDHVATLRQARGTTYPDPVEAAASCELAGADGITVHLREDRRHISERDVEVLRRTVKTLLNLEMAATDAMIAFAVRVKPDLVTLVPEKRQEQTTEGGLDVVGQKDVIRAAIVTLREAGIPTSLFIDPETTQIDASVEIDAAAIELHTGDYANAATDLVRTKELARLARSAIHARTKAPTLRLAAGHGLTSRNVGELLRTVRGIEELNVGHAIVADAVLLGMERAVERFMTRMRDATL